jgi:hypothetical protein
MRKLNFFVALAILAGCSSGWSQMNFKDIASFEYPSNAEITNNEIKYTTMDYYEIQGSNQSGRAFNPELGRPQEMDEYFFELRLYSDESYLTCDETFWTQSDELSGAYPSSTGSLLIKNHTAYFRTYSEMNMTSICVNTKSWGVFGYTISPSADFRTRWIESVDIEN